MNLFRWIPGYDHSIYDPGKEPLLLLFIAFLLTFALTRLYTRVARVRGWGSASAGGVHMHHMVPGVILISLCGALAFSPASDSPAAWTLLAIGFGIGAALTLDEFAMIFHLRDVYWTDEGRTSVDAMLMGVALSALLLVGFAPFDVRSEDSHNSGLAVFFAGVGVNALVAAITFLKKKPFLGVVAIFVPTIGMVTSIRLAKPGSPWSHWFYGPAKVERARARFEYGRFGRFERWFSDVVGGAPGVAPTPPETET